MQALRKRSIRPGREFDAFIPKSSRKDSVIRPAGKAKLHHTINLIKQMVRDTKGDTSLLAKKLKGRNLEHTCQNIWDFVYDHIQYTRDKTGIEQVRRPSRTWADRKHGVDCDCYSVFISSILSNLAIPHRLRITKYGGKPYFQHIYPVVPTGGNTYLALDCVTDQFNYEVPFSGVMDFDMADSSFVGEINEISGISGVDTLDLVHEEMGRVNRGFAPLRKVKRPTVTSQVAVKVNNRLPAKSSITPKRQISKARIAPKAASQRVSILPASVKDLAVVSSTKSIKVNMAGKILLALGVGLGTYKLAEFLSHSATKNNQTQTSQITKN